MTQWFGKSWGAPCCEEDEHVPTPLSARCVRCIEPILEGHQGIVTPLVSLDGASTLVAYHLDCYLKGILPHGPECPHCRGVEPSKHSPDCAIRTAGFCTCIPMPEGE